MSKDNNNSVPRKHRKFKFARSGITTYLASVLQHICHTKGKGRRDQETRDLKPCTQSEAMSSANSTRRTEHLQWLPSN